MKQKVTVKFFNIDRVGVLQNVGIFFLKIFYIEVFSDPKIDKIQQKLVKKNLFKKASSYYSLKTQMRIKTKKRVLQKFFLYNWQN